ncbi:MAG TPA: hypothetical protein VF463_11325 [Sphingobium sp.]
MTVIERAAQAMHASAQPEWDWSDTDCAPLRKIYLDAARAMIASLRDPDEHMQKAGAEVIRYIDRAESDLAHEDDAANIWRLMIDAALEE